MTTDKKVEYIKLLKKKDGRLEKAILFYLTNTNKEYEKKRVYVEKLLDTYAEVEESVHFEGGKCIFLSAIPDEIVGKLISAHSEEMKKEMLKTNQEMIDEMNEIF